jgi:hypothetical protein
MPQRLPHWPYVRAVDEALTARGIPPSSVRADRTARNDGLTTYMWLTWDVSRTGGHGGLRLHWTERQGWFYALIGMSPQHVLLYTVLPTFRTIFPAPQDVADVAEHLVRSLKVPDVEHRTEWAGAREVRAAARDFRRSAFGLTPVGRQGQGTRARMGSEITEGAGVQLTIDTQTDTYEQAIAAVQAAYGLNPAAVASSWPDAPAPASRPGPETLSEDDLWQGWTERMLFDTLASVLPGARAVLRRLVELGGTASYDDVQEHFADHPTTPISKNKIGGTLTSIRAVRRRIGPANRADLLQRDDHRRIYRIEPALTKGLKRAFDLADTRPDLLRQDPAGQ